MRAERDERIFRTLHDESVLARFWAHVDRTESEIACWDWRGPTSKRLPSFQIGSHAVVAVRISWWTATGAFPSGGRFLRTCRNDQCIRPDHLAWQLGKSAEQRLNPFGPLAPSGVALRVAVAEGERPQMLRFVSEAAASTLSHRGVTGA